MITLLTKRRVSTDLGTFTAIEVPCFACKDERCQAPQRHARTSRANLVQLNRTRGLSDTHA